MQEAATAGVMHFQAQLVGYGRDAELEILERNDPAAQRYNRRRGERQW